MEEFNSSSLLLLNITLKDTKHPDNTTTSLDESNGTTGSQPYSTLEISRLVILLIIIIFGSIGNILTFIVMRKGSLKDVSTCFYMSILAVADTGK